MVGGIGSVLSDYWLSSNSNREISNREELCIKDDASINLDVSKEAIEFLDSDKKYYSLDYSEPNILDEAGCSSVEQLQYINSHGLGAQNVDEFRDYIKNFHFLPMAGSLNGAGVNVFSKMDDVLKDLDVNDLIEIDKKLRECSNATEKLNAFSEIFGDLSNNSNLSFKLREDLSDLSDLFSKLAEKMAEIDKNGVMQFSSDLIINLLSDNKEQIDESFSAQNKNKYQSSLIAKYQQ